MKKTVIIIGALVGALAIFAAGFYVGWKVKETRFDFEQSAKGENGEYIGEAKAKKIALDNADLKEADVSFTRVELEEDDGTYIYDVEFRHDLVEYDAEIKADDGKILNWDVDFN